MYVKRMKLYGVNGFRLDLPLSGEGELPEATRKRMLLQGGNGSGKTTIIESIAGLWNLFGEMIDGSSMSFSFPRTSRWNASLTAMELGDFPKPGDSFWIACGGSNEINDLKLANPDTPIASLYRVATNLRVELPPGDWKTIKLRSQQGMEPLPNIVHYPPDHRSPNPSRGSVKRLDLYDKNWLAVYDADYDLDSLLFTIRAMDPEKFEESIILLDRLLLPSGKQLDGVQDRQGRLLIDIIGERKQQPHPWIALSSGERQMLLLVVYAVCLLRDDSILLIDEPDLHIHVGMVKQLLDTLYSVAEKRNCQLIVSGHSQVLWDWFGLDAEMITLGAWQEAEGR